MFRSAIVALLFTSSVLAAEPKPKWSPEVERALVAAKDNRGELEKALAAGKDEQRKGMIFLIENMPEADLKSLKADFLIANVELAYKARKQLPWGKDIPEEIFLNDVLPYANVDEKRDAWRAEFFELCLPMVANCKTPAEAAQKLNSELFAKIKLRYSTQRKAPNQSPKESMELGMASCTGLSIVLSDACRSVCVPARLVGTPLWANKRGNHTWVEIWDQGWHFTGACEQDKNGLDRGWFVGDAAQAKKDSYEHAIYASSFKKSEQHFPLVWAINNKSVAAENVTDRYARKETPKTTARILVRVIDPAKKCVAAGVTATVKGESKPVLEGTSRGEKADANDLLGFDVKPETEYTIRVGGSEKTIRSGKVGSEQILEVALPVSTSPDAAKSAAALKELQKALEGKTALADVAGKEFAGVALTKADAAEARKRIAQAHLAAIRAERGDEVKNRLLKEKNLEMPFFYDTFGKKPEGGRSLWISLHGGGGAPKQVNDQQWENQKKLYKVDEGIYLAPRAPTNTWNLWHEAHIDRLFGRLIEDLIAIEDVNPDRVYVLGYSAGGDGVYQIAPRMADYWAGAAMMAGHPNGVPLLSLRNVPFALQVGADDAAYNRNKVGREYGEQLDKLQKEDPKGYEHFVKIHAGKGHWMNLEDKAALPWMAKFTRNPVPERIVWKQSGTPHDRSYWLALPGEVKGDALVVAERKGQAIDLVTAEKVSDVIIRLDDRMVNLDEPVKVSQGGKELFSGLAPRKIASMVKTLLGRGDPKLMFDAEVEVKPAAKEAK